MITNTVTENIELDVNLMRCIKELDGYVMSHKRLEAAVHFVDSIIKQLCPEDRRVFEEVEDDMS